MKGKARSYDELYAYCVTVPLVDCHDHSIELGPKYTDPIQVIIGDYFLTDLGSATSEAAAGTLSNQEIPWEERWPILERAWQRTCHTGYAQITRRVLKKFYHEDELTLAALHRMEDRLIDLTDESVSVSILDEAKIAVRLADVWPDVKQVLDGTYKLSPRSRLVIPLPAYHRVRDYPGVQELVAPLGRMVTTLDEYTDACREIFEGFKTFGAVAFKDQSAYSRSLNYKNPTRAEAEQVFNWFMEDPLRSASYPDGVQPLDDYLFHAFIRMAHEMDLPVQVHTGHLAGLYGDITKANAAGLANLLMLHRDVKFDLFHANWPYAGEILFLCKNYPNAALDFCWTNVIDPVYCQNLFRQALSSVPHGKIHAYGSDFSGFADRAWAHAQITRENVAAALSDMVELGYLGVDEAKEVAYAWLFNNASEFYRLEL